MPGFSSLFDSNKVRKLSCAILHVKAWSLEISLLPLYSDFHIFLASPDALEVIVVSDSLTHSLTDR